ncbi:hypothetical protein BU24DRAFT_344488 [Aaosphaeria arxii CBS 175.79]|uniref:Uncharacterized protein n=1 Tax=Aaosphaeria arxii CBS 175.79 TaxID=1450172 RepID=A0A6A5XY71_9PLEO|nr:uncharacterized protein BU24DRAFT_344488 [Aaosphaeria arxii CBS 175.79]KAF2017777.1 hypothetical protein BU24DRAFT_344488 [Aaosphaeria arxii CBS 175.79]
MAAAAMPPHGIALHGAPDGDIGSKDAKHSPVQAMQLEMTQDMVDELLQSVNSGNTPQIIFGRTPQLKYGDKTHVLNSTPEAYRYELYRSDGSENDDDLEFAGLINHSLAVQKAEDVMGGVDTALEQLKNSMAAMAELKEANKTIVGDAATSRNPGHRRLPSKSLNKSQLLTPSSAASPLPKAPTSQPSGNHHLVLRALRTPLIHLLAVQPSKDTYLAETCRTSVANIREVLPKIARPMPDDKERWQLVDKSLCELNPWKFTYRNSDDREKAIESAIKSFDRLRTPKDDKLWQILLPVQERGQGKCLSRLNLKAPEQKDRKPSTPVHKMTKNSDKKTNAKKPEDKDAEKKVKEGKDTPEVKPKKVVREKPTATPKTATPANRNTPTMNATKIRTKKPAPAGEGASPRVRPQASARDLSQRERNYRPPPKPAVNTKPKNPSPLSASPPVNASDFEDSHPVHKKLSAAPSPAKPSSGNSDRTLKRKANDIDSDIHNHNLSVKSARTDRPTPSQTPSSTSGRLSGNTPSSTSSLKRKSDDSSTSNTPTNKIRKFTNIDTGLASRYQGHNSQISPGDSSSSGTSPTLPSLSFRQTVELSQKFQKYYKRYEELYWQLADATSPPTESQRNELMRMHKKLEEMKREIKTGAGLSR